MKPSNRRDFLKFLASATVASVLPLTVHAATTPPRDVVVGGGFGGATAAKYLKTWGGNVDVTFVDPKKRHMFLVFFPILSLPAKCRLAIFHSGMMLWAASFVCVSSRIV